MQIGLGCMRLSTDPDRDQARAQTVLRTALDAGIDVLDTADAYCDDDSDVGHNEALIAELIRGRVITVVTKGGLERRDGMWHPNGRARHLAAAARASRQRLGVATIDLYLLHAVDPRTPLITSVRALAKLRDDGIARAIGLSNVNLMQLEHALELTTIDAVEIELNPWRLDAVRGGLLAACERRGIRVLAHRPLGGPAGVRRVIRDRVVDAVARAVHASPCEVVLAWLRSLAPGLVPLPGATRVESVASIVHAATLSLDDQARSELDRHFIGDRAVGQQRSGEVVMIVGMPGAGKSTLAERYVAQGYARLNRDDRGGSLRDVARELDRMLADTPRIVVDNTYPTRASRAPVITVAKRHGVAVRCLVADTPLEHAQHNAVARVLARYGRLAEPDELARDKQIGPGAQFRFRRQYEPPRSDEGFDTIDTHGFERTPLDRGAPALIVELDGVVWTGRPREPSRIALVPGIIDQLARWRAAGYVLAATTWQPEPFDPTIDDALVAALAMPLAIARCRHPAGPPVCWCRKPLPGLALALARDHQLALAHSVHAGTSPADRGFAMRAGARYVDVAARWPAPPDGV
ncbi:MAG: aldo/keto reductase [Kofleriaceae bacterium]